MDTGMVSGDEIERGESPSGGRGGIERIRIIVNGRPKVVTDEKLSWREVVLLAFDPIPTGPQISITVTYRNAVAPRHTGTLVPGQSVVVQNGTVFNVRVTDKS